MVFDDDHDYTAAFDAAAADFARLRPDLWEPVAERTLAVSAPAPGERVLDACCGDGASALPAARRVGPTGHVDAVDLSPGLLRTLEQRAHDTPQLRTVQSDVTSWGEAGRYDLVQCILGVFFFPDMTAGTRHLVSLARPGGRVALTIWRRGAIEPIGAALHDAVSPDEPDEGPAADEHLVTQVNTPDTWHAWLTGLGLEDVAVVESPYTLHLDDELAWRVVLGSGFRAVVADLSPAQQDDARVRFLDLLDRRDLRTMDATTLVGLGTAVA